MSLLDDLTENLDVNNLDKVAGPLQEMLSKDGVQDILGKLNAVGLGDQVQSWVGKAKNLPVSAEQIQSALGNDTVKSIAAKIGIPTDKVAGAIAHLLPQTVDKMTPDGTPPAPDAKVPDIMDIVKNVQAIAAKSTK
jgi:uncharacterized protein YidB (DUF937 family)